MITEILRTKNQNDHLIITNCCTTTIIQIKEHQSAMALYDCLKKYIEENKTNVEFKSENYK